jgi:hypothetical protein
MGSHLHAGQKMGSDLYSTVRSRLERGPHVRIACQQGRLTRPPLRLGCLQEQEFHSFKAHLTLAPL